MKYTLVIKLCALLALLATGCRKELPLPSAEATPVVVYEIQPATIREQIILSGTAMPWQHIRLTAEIGGQLVEVAMRPDSGEDRREIREGDSVTIGEALFGIDTASLKADLRAAESAADYAQETFGRYTKLRDRGAASEEEFQRWQSQAEQARQNVNAARARLQRAQVNAPMNGVLDRKFADLGSNVTPGEALADIVSIQRLKVVIAVPENAVQHVTEGDELTLVFDGLGEQVLGRVIFVAAMADAATLTFPVHLEVDNSDGRLRAGNIAKVRLVKRIIPQAVAAPLPAIISGVTGYRVMVVENGIARGRQVELGVMDSGLFEIRTNLKLGDLLIVQGQREAVEGQPVDVRATVRDLKELPRILPELLPEMLPFLSLFAKVQYQPQECMKSGY